jgi:hypothetical protein
VTSAVRRMAGACGLLALAVALISLVGCGSGSRATEKPFAVKGRLVKSGVPIQPKTDKLPPADSGIQLIFLRVGGQPGEEYAANVNPHDGTFNLPGLEGKGVPKGHYRIAVILAPVGGVDQFRGKYGKENSRVEKEITGKEDNLVIDIDKPNS